MARDEALGMCESKYWMEERMKNCASATTCTECLEDLKAYQCNWGQPLWSSDQESVCTAESGFMVC